MVNINLDSAETLQRAAYFCHDASFNINQIVFDGKEKTFSLRLFRLILEESILKKDYLFFKIYHIPRIESILFFYEVNKFELHTKYPHDTVTEIRYNSKKNRIEINCANNTSINLMVDRIVGKLEDSGASFFEGAKIIKFLGMELIRLDM